MTMRSSTEQSRSTLKRFAAPQAGRMPWVLLLSQYIRDNLFVLLVKLKRDKLPHDAPAAEMRTAIDEIVQLIEDAHAEREQQTKRLSLWLERELRDRP